MQLLPFYKSYKILEQYPIVKDDTGSNMCLTLLEVVPKQDIFNHKRLSVIEKFWVVISDKKTNYSKLSVAAYDTKAYWSKNIDDKHELFNGIVNGLHVEECINKKDIHNMFGDRDKNLKTYFKITDGILS